MKKLVPVIFGIIIGAVLTYYFCPRPSDDMPTIGEEEIIKPKGVVSVADARSLNNNWTKFRKAAVDSAARKQGRDQDNRSASWSIKDVRDYLNYADYEAKKVGYVLDSVRVYLGVYGAKASKEKANLTTMFIAPVGTIGPSKASAMPSINSMLFQAPGIPPLNDGGGGATDYNP